MVSMDTTNPENPISWKQFMEEKLLAEQEIKSKIEEDKKREIEAEERRKESEKYEKEISRNFQILEEKKNIEMALEMSRKDKYRFYLLVIMGNGRHRRIVKQHEEEERIRSEMNRRYEVEEQKRKDIEEAEYRFDFNFFTFLRIFSESSEYF